MAATELLKVCKDASGSIPERRKLRAEHMPHGRIVDFMPAIVVHPGAHLSDGLPGRFRVLGFERRWNVGDGSVHDDKDEL